MRNNSIPLKRPGRKVDTLGNCWKKSPAADTTLGKVRFRTRLADTGG